VSVMEARRVVVTGGGVVSPLGLDVDRHWSRLLNGESGVVACDRANCHTLPPHLGGLIQGFERRDFIDDRMVRKLLSPNGAYRWRRRATRSGTPASRTNTRC